MERTIKLIPMVIDSRPCEHFHLDWGFYPSVIRCRSCGSNWVALINPKPVRRLEKWDWFIIALFGALVVVALHTSWDVLIGSWAIVALAETGDYIKRRRRRNW
jgi:hypothetical protein